MFGGLSNLRPSERGPAIAAFLTLFAVMAAHAILEAARDALFLSRVSATRLPWVYLIVAVLAFGITWLHGKRRDGSNLGLTAWLSTAALGTVGFWFLVQQSATRWLYGFYVMTAVVTTVATAELWLLLSRSFTVTEAKRVFTAVGAGSVLGAVSGSLIATLLASFLPPRHLLLVASVLLGAGAFVSRWLRALRQSDTFAEEAKPAGRNTFGQIFSHRYVRRTVATLVVASVTLTVVDYLFKSGVARSVPSEQLAMVFASVYLGLNLVSLGVQLWVVQPVVRRFSVGGGLAVLPLLLVFGGLGAALGLGIAAALLLKAADGSLRHSLHRTAAELLFVPMPERLRAVVKPLIDTVGQRGGQAVASLAILAVVSVTDDEGLWLGLGTTALALLWLGLTWALRKPYLDLFRATLADVARAPRRTRQRMDLSTLEAALLALNSSDPSQVRAAMDYLASEGRVRLIPALILYHPDDEVVMAALQHFVVARREDFLTLLDHVLQRDAASARAAALRALIALAPDEASLRKHYAEGCSVLAATALVGLVAEQWASEEETAGLLKFARGDDEEASIALADAIAATPSSRFAPVVCELAKANSLAVRMAALKAMAAVPDAAYLEALIPMLAERALRTDARRALADLAEKALPRLIECLGDTELAVGIRHHLPRTIMRFETTLAADALLRQLPQERDGVVRYKILRALGRLLADDPKLKLDQDLLFWVASDTLTVAYRLLDWRIQLEAGAKTRPERQTAAYNLLIGMLRDKEQNAIERLFRLLGLLHPKEDVETLFRGLTKGDARLRASSWELLESFLHPDLRGAVVGLIDGGTDDERLASGGSLHASMPRSYAMLIEELLGTGSDSLVSLACYHAAEIDLVEIRPTLESLQPRAGSLLSVAVQRALTAIGVNGSAPVFAEGP